MFVNLGLRHVVNWVDQRFLAGEDAIGTAYLRVSCKAECEGAVREAMIKRLGENELALSALESRSPRDGVAELAVTLALPAAAAAKLDRVVAALATEPGLHSVGWNSDQGD